MLITFQVILLFVILISFSGSCGEKKDQNLRSGLVGICVVSIISFVVTLL